MTLTLDVENTTAKFGNQDPKLVLTKPEEKLVTQFFRIFDDPEEDNTLRKNTIHKVLFGEKSSYALKHKIATHYFDDESSILWGYEFMDGAALWWMTELHPLTASYLQAALRNHSWTWESARTIFCDNRKVPANLKNDFFKLLPDEVKTFDFLGGILTELETTNLGPDLVTGEARRIFDLDEGIPDSWVVRMFTVEKRRAWS